MFSQAPPHLGAQEKAEAMSLLLPLQEAEQVLLEDADPDEKLAVALAAFQVVEVHSQRLRKRTVRGSSTICCGWPRSGPRARRRARSASAPGRSGQRQASPPPTYSHTGVPPPQLIRSRPDCQPRQHRRQRAQHSVQRQRLSATDGPRDPRAHRPAPIPKPAPALGGHCAAAATPLPRAGPHPSSLSPGSVSRQRPKHVNTFKSGWS